MHTFLELSFLYYEMDEINYLPDPTYLFAAKYNQRRVSVVTIFLAVSILVKLGIEN